MILMIIGWSVNSDGHAIKGFLSSAIANILRSNFNN